ncbi:hypothetical protein [uncultured Draconibacterium sp.]|uniref:hypothetical protein n=1 Tax=uncultured Draconibacterium sp. TaxID=1573823 RepID=UPI00326098F4
MRKITLVFLLFLFVKISFGQEEGELIKSRFKLTIVNPGVEYEFKMSEKSTLALNLGIGYGGSYKDLKTSGDGFMYLLSPFYDMQYRNYYNVTKRNSAGKNVKYNSSNYFGVRLLVRGPEIASSFSRTSELDYAFGPTWGIQRSFNQFNVLFDVGPYVYFDMKGEYGFLPMFQLNIGYNLRK